MNGHSFWAMNIKRSARTNVEWTAHPFPTTAVPSEHQQAPHHPSCHWPHSAPRNHPGALSRVLRPPVPCDVRDVMPHPAGPSQQAGSLPRRTCPRNTSAALPHEVTSLLRLGSPRANAHSGLAAARRFPPRMPPADPESARPPSRGARSARLTPDPPPPPSKSRLRSPPHGHAMPPLSRRQRLPSHRHPPAVPTRSPASPAPAGLFRFSASARMPSEPQPLTTNLTDT